MVVPLECNFIRQKDFSGIVVFRSDNVPHIVSKKDQYPGMVVLEYFRIILLGYSQQFHDFQIIALAIHVVTHIEVIE